MSDGYFATLWASLALKIEPGFDCFYARPKYVTHTVESLNGLAQVLHDLVVAVEHAQNLANGSKQVLIYIANAN